MSKFKTLTDNWFDLEDRISALDLNGINPARAETALAALSSRQTECVRDLIHTEAASLEDVLQKLLIWMEAEGPMDKFSPDSDFNLYGHLAKTAVLDLQKLLQDKDDDMKWEPVA